MRFETIFANLGLSKQESTVYLAALKLGSAPASSIAKTAGLERTTVYPVLKSLAKEGLVMVHFQQKERRYRAQNPVTLARRYEKTLQDFTSIIPELNKLRQNQVLNLGFRFIETASELKRFYADVLIEYRNKEYYVISSSQGWMGIDTEFFTQLRKDREKANIKTKLILTHESQKTDPPNGTLLRTAKYLPPSYTFKSSINIFSDKILISGRELTSLAVIIEIPAMTDIFKSVFRLLWDTLPNNI